MIRRILFCALCGLLLLSNAVAYNFPYSEWTLSTYNGAFATFDNGFVAVANGGDDYWYVQLVRRNIELKTGKTYELKYFLQSTSTRRYIEVRIGRDGFPYDAFAEFGEVVATTNGRIVTKSFVMQSENISNARFEFNLGKYAGSVYLSDISLTCLDCDEEISNSVIAENEVAKKNEWKYLVVADSVDFRDYTMALGTVYGMNLKLGADSKIYGDVIASANCFLRERTSIRGSLLYASECSEQNGILINKKEKIKVQKPVLNTGSIAAGIAPVSSEIEETISIRPGNYGPLYANSKSKIKLSSGTYNFQDIYSEPETSFSFDLSSGPIFIGVQKNVRFGDRNSFSIAGGNPSEIFWNVAGNSAEFGTDGLYFGKILAPQAYVRISSRSHLIGGVYARKFVIEPQSTVSQEPRAKEISHSEEHFGPFFDSGTFRYRSMLSLSTSGIEMFVYADGDSIKIDGTKSAKVNLTSENKWVVVSIEREKIPGFPSESFHSDYRFNFIKSSRSRVYWNPQTKCREGCDGSSAASAIGEFSEVLRIAEKDGREINMAGGVWDASDYSVDGVVPWKVGFELVGFTGNIWNLTSATDMPTVFLGENSHIRILGKSPRSLVGFWISNGFNKEMGGAVYSGAQKTTLRNIMLSANKSNNDGGALFALDTIEMKNVLFKDNLSKRNGGAISSKKYLTMQNVVFSKNTSEKDGGAVFSLGNAIAQNMIFNHNTAVNKGGAWFAQNGDVIVSNATIFDNEGMSGNPAVGGNAEGTLFNSILWKNIKESCTAPKCKEEIPSTIAVHHSITEIAVKGEGNIIGNPNFVDENNPEGKCDFMCVSAGLTLQDSSSAIAAGVDNSFVLKKDILGVARNEQIDLGAYAWYDLNADYVAGQLTFGKFVPAKVRIPVFRHLDDVYDIFAKGNGKYARVLRKKVPRAKVKDMEKIVVTFTLVNENGDAYKDVPPVNIPFFKYEETETYVIFQTLTKNATKRDYDPDKHGRNLLFTSVVDKVGTYGNVQVVPILKESDKLKGTVSW